MAVAVLDTCVILGFALADKDVETLELLFNQINTGKIKAIIPSIVLAEIFAILWKLKEIEKAVEIEEYLDTIGVETTSVTRDMAVFGGLLKGRYAKARRGFSYADGILLAQAIMIEAPILTYDSEFQKVTEVPIFEPKAFLKTLEKKEKRS